MPWIVCIACHHTAQIKPLPRGKRLRCTACGSSGARVVRTLKLSMLNGGQVAANVAKTLLHGALISIAAHRGYKRGWAGMKYRAIYGYWPDGDPEPCRPSSELLWWLRKQNAAYAQAQRRLDEGDNSKDPIKQLSPDRDSSLMSDDDWNVDL